MPTAVCIFNTLTENEYLRVLDFSCNSLGLGPGSFIGEITSFFGKNKTLRHLDMSNNYIDYENSVKISEGLEKNQSIYGFHYAGNCGYVDSRGFLVINKED